MKVRSTIGSSDWKSPACKCKTWIEHWCNNTNEKHFPAKCPNCKKKVENASDWDGAHVRKVDSEDKKFYITPLCSSCNSKPGLEFDVDVKYLVRANAIYCSNKYNK